MDPIKIEIDGTLDLHTFHPSEVSDLVREYIKCCLAEKITDVRIIHGKGKGVLRRKVHSVLGTIPEVESYRLAGSDGGEWGATLVKLKI